MLCESRNHRTQESPLVRTVDSVVESVLLPEPYPLIEQPSVQLIPDPRSSVQTEPLGRILEPIPAEPVLANALDRNHGTLFAARALTFHNAGTPLPAVERDRQSGHP